MSFWSRRKPPTKAETPDETLARLQSAASPSRFPLVRGGYDVEEVDAFLATIDQRTADEVRNVLFRASRRKAGYAQDEVDRFLDGIEAQKRR